MFRYDFLLALIANLSLKENMYLRNKFSKKQVYTIFLVKKRFIQIYYHYQQK